MTLRALEAALADEGGLLADSLAGAGAGGEDVFAPLVAAGPRTRATPDDYAFVIEGVLEGYLLHYAHGRVVAPSDPDLRLLCGDYLYALGLVRLASLGDLEAVAELSDLITLCARAHAAARSAEHARVAARSLWAGSALAVAGGAWPEHERLKRKAAADVVEGDDDVVLAAVRARAERLDLRDDLERALIAFDRAVETRISTT
jgi:hypothetical protein